MPIAPCLGYWMFTSVYYHIGLVRNPSLSWETYGLLFIYLVVIAVGFLVGIKGSPLASPIETRHPRTQLTMHIYLWASLIGHLLLVADKSSAGVNFSVVRNQTELLRDNFSTTTLTTYSVPLCGLLYPGLVKWFNSLGEKPNLFTASAALVVGNVSFVLVIAIFSGNRAIFLQMVLWLLFLYFHLLPGFSRSAAFLNTKLAALVARTRKAMVVAAIVFTGISVGYFVFISTYRISEEFLASQVGSAELRYNVAGVVNNPRTEMGVVMLSEYMTQQFVYMNTINESAAPVAWDFAPFAFWYLRQIDRLGFSTYDASVERYRGVLRQRGLSDYGWPSLFGHATLSLGWLGGPLVIGALAAALGACVKAYWHTRRESFLLFAFTLYSFFSYSYMAIPSDHYIAIGVIVAAIWWITERLESGQNNAYGLKRR